MILTYVIKLSMLLTTVFSQNGRLIFEFNEIVKVGIDNLQIICLPNATTEFQIYYIKLEWKNDTINFIDLVTLSLIPGSDFTVEWGSTELKQRASVEGSNINPGYLNFTIHSLNVILSDTGTYQCKIHCLHDGKVVDYTEQGTVKIKGPASNIKEYSKDSKPVVVAVVVPVFVIVVVVIIAVFVFKHNGGQIRKLKTYFMEF